MTEAKASIVGGCILDLFAGAKGWGVGARAIGLTRLLSIEIDDVAVATSRAAGFETLQADVAKLDPREFAPAWGVLASPPCQAFSPAGTGEGRRGIEAYRDAVRRMASGETVDRDTLEDACSDERAHLVLEPLRWTLALMPVWVACEQVAPVLPIWEAMAASLTRHGYSARAEILTAEQYGVPQTRKRAILIARRDGTPARMPSPTHQRYVPPRRVVRQVESLFDAGEPQRIVAPGGERLLPWVSMAEALGWGMTDRPTHTTTAGGTGSGGGIEVFGGGDVRDIMTRERDAGRWRNPDRPGEDASPLDEPAGGPSLEDGEQRGPQPTGIMVEHRRSGDRLGEQWSADRPSDAVTSRVDRWRVWTPEDHVGFQRRDDASETAGAFRERDLRAATEPAATITARARSAIRILASSRENGIGGSHSVLRDPASGMVDAAGPCEAAGDGPSPTITTTRPSEDGMLGGRQLPPGERHDIDGQDWPRERPATTVQGDPRVWPPGHKVNAADEAAGREGYGDRAGTNAVRVTVEEAACLQSFPADHPWHGTRSKIFEQIGNAIPPLLAEAIIREAIG